MNLPSITHNTISFDNAKKLGQNFTNSQNSQYNYYQNSKNGNLDINDKINYENIQYNEKNELQIVENVKYTKQIQSLQTEDENLNTNQELGVNKEQVLPKIPVKNRTVIGSYKSNYQPDSHRGSMLNSKYKFKNEINQKKEQKIRSFQVSPIKRNNQQFNENDQLLQLDIENVSNYLKQAEKEQQQMQNMLQDLNYNSYIDILDEQSYKFDMDVRSQNQNLNLNLNNLDSKKKREQSYIDKISSNYKQRSQSCSGNYNNQSNFQNQKNKKINKQYKQDMQESEQFLNLQKNVSLNQNQMINQLDTTDRTQDDSVYQYYQQNQNHLQNNQGKFFGLNDLKKQKKERYNFTNYQRNKQQFKKFLENYETNISDFNVEQYVENELCQVQLPGDFNYQKNNDGNPYQKGAIKGSTKNQIQEKMKLCLWEQTDLISKKQSSHFQKSQKEKLNQSNKQEKYQYSNFLKKNNQNQKKFLDQNVQYSNSINADRKFFSADNTDQRQVKNRINKFKTSSQLNIDTEIPNTKNSDKKKILDEITKNSLFVFDFGKNQNQQNNINNTPKFKNTEDRLNNQIEFKSVAPVIQKQPQKLNVNFSFINSNNKITQYDKKNKEQLKQQDQQLSKQKQQRKNQKGKENQNETSFDSISTLDSEEEKKINDIQKIVQENQAQFQQNIKKFKNDAQMKKQLNKEYKEKEFEIFQKNLFSLIHLVQSLFSEESFLFKNFKSTPEI
ncbi:hypothetical protein PPERSA_08117 [Pseudocohnilembus persalinus]|uniref:Uncharacterized protein n=1 Tax=Pseudocohnilembus persalinus TaxID=266149 RepID=A0A0V0QLD1_PSEPJ|nr:hypothetical protein PPERSA_08117 [Pseudocohnilembus persalinus]|eukprot:KRX03042.1 hypothetical protein PPERSA_08117 [Pseudocohnilembus persalinus]